MHGLATDADVRFLRLAEFESLTVSRHEVVLHLFPRISINVTAFVRLVSPDGEELISEESLQIARAMLSLVGSTVADVSIVPSGTLRSTWSSGHVLDLIDSEEHYESYTIQNGDQVIVV